MPYHPTDVHIARRLREARVSRGISQQAVAVHLGVSFQQVQKYESGANRISGSRLWDLCEFLELEPNYFFEGLKDVGEQPDEQAGPSHSRVDLTAIRAFNAIPSTEIKSGLVKLMQTLAGAEMEQA